MNIKPHTRNNMKKQIFILLAIMIIATGAYAQITLQSFQIGQNYLQGTSLKVANINSATPFKFLVSVTRGINSGGGFVSGNCTIKLYYTENQSSDSNIPDDPTSLLLFTKNITSSDYNSSQAILADLDASLPANKQYGKLILRFEYLDNQNINRINYSSTRYGIYVVPPTKSDIYLVSHKGSTSDYNDIFQLVTTVPSGWYNNGIDFKAFTSSNSIGVNGAVAIYQHKFKVFDQSTGLLGDPREIFYYSTSQTLTVTPFSGYTYQLESSSIAFYAFSTQVAGTIPVYQCSHKNAPIQLYLSSNADIADSYNTQIAFYAFPI